MTVTPIFVVNLEKDKAKKQKIQKLCDKFNLEVEFICAVNGNDLTKTEIDNIYDKNNSLKNIDRELTKGEIGCALSHRNIYQKMVDENINQAIILEDDARFNQNFKTILKLVPKLPKDWHLLLLGFDVYDLSKYFYKIKKTLSYTISIPLENADCTYGYLINKTGAKVLLKATKKLAMPIDCYTGDYHFNNVLTLDPKIITTDSASSSISNDREKQQTIGYQTTKLTTTKRLLKFFRLLNFITIIINEKHIKIFRLSLKYYIFKLIYKKF
jgi:glycosyl transferase family 25